MGAYKKALEMGVFLHRGPIGEAGGSPFTGHFKR